MQYYLYCNVSIFTITLPLVEKFGNDASALKSIEICFVWIPIAVYAIGLVIMKFWYLDNLLKETME